MSGVGSSLGTNHPIRALAVQHVLHVHSRAGRTVALGLEVNLGGGFVFAKTDRRHRHFHVKQARPLRQIGQNPLAYRVLVLDVFLAAAQDSSEAGNCHKGGAIHISIIAERSLVRVGCLRYTKRCNSGLSVSCSRQQGQKDAPR